MRINVCFTVLALALAGCNPDESSQPDQCLRPALFQQCMASLPKGPERIAAAGNDWDEVVSECGRIAYSQSKRQIEFIKPECRP